MKKLLLTAIMLLTVTTSCFAADTKNINKEINTTEDFTQILFELEDTENGYQKITKNFSPALKEKFTEQRYNALKKNLKVKCGNLNNLYFKLVQREGNNDIVLFTAKTQKAGNILINLYFNQDGKVLNYGIGTAKN